MLDDRAKLLLKTLVERYIADGQPVGSRTLARRLSTMLSPATIRNVMADLVGPAMTTDKVSSKSIFPGSFDESFRFRPSRLRQAFRPIGRRLIKFNQPRRYQGRPPRSKSAISE